jgi:tRNA threonylcarbamoyl adenosine modification protein (Sua5/YciO/YrdC/YwlC family)
MTEILPTTAEGLAAAAQLVADGRLVAFPTDTVYGVGGAFDRKELQSTLERLKGRPEGKPIPVLVADASQVTAAGYVLGERGERLAARWWPGPLTLVLPASGDGVSLGFRVPDHDVALSLIKLAGPLLTTSANRSGEPETLGADEVQIAFAVHGDLLAAVVDGGPAPGGTASTVVDLTADPARILREGAISREAVSEVVPVASPID